MSASYQAVVLAAGAGSRFGGGKLLADWRGRPVICATVEATLRTGADEVVVVLGCDAPGVASALEPLRCERLRCTIAGDWPEGLGASLRRGVESLPAGSAGFLLFLGDMPLTPPALGDLVLARLKAGAAAVQPFHGAVPAHPVGFSARLYPDLLALTGDAGARRLLSGRDNVTRLDVEDSGAVFDIDRPGDLARAGEASPQ